MAIYSRYFHADLPSGSRTTCFWGTCFYPIGTYWNYPQYRRITLTLTSASGAIDNISMYSWTGTLPAVTPATAENFLDMGSSPAVGHSASVDFPAGSDGFSIEIKATDAAYPLDVRVDYDIVPGDVGYCQYGTRLKPAQQVVQVISDAAITAAAILVPEIDWLAVAFGALVGLSWIPGNVCNGPPPQMPTFTAADFVGGTQIPAPGSLAKLMTAFQSIVWPQYCECLPATGGGPAPIVYPPAIQPQPPGAPGPIAPIVCDNTDLCATLLELSRQLTSMSGQLSLVRQDVQLIQRQGVPFGYVIGSIHSALSNSGQFAIADILGLAVTFTTLPGIYQPSLGDPDTYHQLGKISVGTVDGWERSWQPTHSPYMILPIPGAVTLVGFSFAPGIVATISELLREP
jgi:hypothetical protein